MSSHRVFEDLTQMRRIEERLLHSEKLVTAGSWLLPSGRRVAMRKTDVVSREGARARAWHATCSAWPGMRRGDPGNELVDVLVYVLWIALLLLVLQHV